MLASDGKQRPLLESPSASPSVSGFLIFIPLLEMACSPIGPHLQSLYHELLDDRDVVYSFFIIRDDAIISDK